MSDSFEFDEVHADILQGYVDQYQPTEATGNKSVIKNARERRKTVIKNAVEALWALPDVQKAMKTTVALKSVRRFSGFTAVS